MSEERKPVWPWIAALLIGLPVLYVASIGPAAWSIRKPWFPQTLYWPLVTIYSPLDWIDKTGPQPIHDVLNWYVDLWR